MTAYLVNRYKRPNEAGAVPEPTVGERNVPLEVHAAGVNLLDAKIRNGEFKLILPYKAPFVVGHSSSGGRPRAHTELRAIVSWKGDDRRHADLTVFFISTPAPSRRESGGTPLCARNTSASRPLDARRDAMTRCRAP